jgi:hypothetical protein
MFKNVISALVVSGVMLSGAAYAADAQTQTPAQTPAQVQSQTAKPVVAEKTTVKKVHHVAAKKVKTEKQQAATPAPASATAPAKTN